MRVEPVIGTDLLRAVHLQDDLVREPVRHEVGDDGEHEAEHQPLRAAERLADEEQQRAQRAEKECGFEDVGHGSIRSQTPRTRGVRVPAGRYNSVMLAALVVSLSLAAALHPSQDKPVPQPFPRPGSPTVQAPPTRPAQPSPPPPPALPRPRRERRPWRRCRADRGDARRPHLSGRPVPHVVRRGTRSAVLPVRIGGLVCRRRWRTTARCSSRGASSSTTCPATHEFDVGRFDEETMAFPPGVTIKDFQSEVSQGFPNPKPGGEPARFPTIIQIVPVVDDQIAALTAART